MTYNQLYMQNSNYKNNNKADKIIHPIIYYNEEFRQISKYISDIKDCYFISNHGRIFNMNTGYILRPNIMNNGYLSIGLFRKDNSSKKIFNS